MSLQEIETAIAKLSPDELRAFSAWFAEFLATGDGSSAQTQDRPSAKPGSVSFERIEDLAGSVKGGPPDLASNKKYLEGLGESSMR